MTMTSNPDRLTLIMPVRDRVEFARRWFTYAERVRLPFEVRVADGGLTTAVEDLLADTARFPSVRRRHVRHPGTGDFGGYIRRLADTLDTVDTPYVCLVADDDFPVVDGMLAAMAFLDAHPDHVSARGDILEFTIPESSACNAFGDPAFYRSGYFDAPSRDAETALERIVMQCDRFCSGYLNVQRTEVARARFGFMRDIGARETWMPGIIDDMGHLAAGKAAHLPELFTLKHTNASGNEARNISEQEPTLLDWMIRPGWSAEMGRMVDYVAGEVARVDGLDPARALGEFKRLFFARYLARIVGLKARGAGRAMPGTAARRREQWLGYAQGRISVLRAKARGWLAARRHLRSPQGDEMRAMIQVCRRGATAVEPARCGVEHREVA